MAAFLWTAEPAQELLQCLPWTCTHECVAWVLFASCVCILCLQVCVDGFRVSAIRCPKNSKPYKVAPSDTCQTIQVQKFKRRVALIPRYNKVPRTRKGFVCTPKNLVPGMTLCIPRFLT